MNLGPQAAMATLELPSAAVAGPRWIASRNFDLLFFVMAPLLGLAMLLGERFLPGGFLVVLFVAYVLGVPHYISTFTFFLDDTSLTHYWSRRAAFFLGPLLILVSVFVLQYFRGLVWLQAAVFLWNVYHVALQSAGILSLYRRLNNGLAQERQPAHMSILWTGAAMALWNVENFPPVATTLSRIHPLLMQWAGPACALVAVASVSVLLWRLRQRPGGMSQPEAWFLLSSLVLFHPYLWVSQGNLATLGLLTGHFLQYLAIVWLLHHRRHGIPSGSWHQRALAAVGRSGTTVVAFVLVSGMFFYGAERVASRVGLATFYDSLFYAVVLSHFYLDGLIWAFRRPFVRDTIGSYLTGPQQV